MDAVMVEGFRPERLDEYVDLYMKTYAAPPWNESWESRNIVAGFMLNHYNNNYFRGFAAIKNNRVAGVSIGFLKPWIQGMEYYIDEFFVDVSQHRQGIGRTLMEQIKKELLRENVHAIFLNTERGYPSQAFYESMGFHAEESLVILDMSF